MSAYNFPALWRRTVGSNRPRILNLARDTRSPEAAGPAVSDQICQAKIVLYVAGTSPGSVAARLLVESLLESGDYPGCTLAVIDTLRQTAGLRGSGIVSVPALCLYSDGERRWFGDPLIAKERLRSWLQREYRRAIRNGAAAAAQPAGL